MRLLKRPAVISEPWVEFVGGPIDALRFRLGPGSTMDLTAESPAPAFAWQARLLEIAVLLPDYLEWPADWTFGWVRKEKPPHPTMEVYRRIARVNRIVLYAWRP